MESLFRLPTAIRRDPDVDSWFAHSDALRLTVQPWFEELRGCGTDIRELLHDGRPTVCAGEAAFAYVDAYTKHATIGFFYGAFLEDPVAGLLQGAGKRMRHVKLHWGRPPDAVALRKLIKAAYRDVQHRLKRGA
jgi:hypothetical protein